MSAVVRATPDHRTPEAASSGTSASSIPAVPAIGMEDVPGLARIAAATFRHTTVWGLGVSVRTTVAASSVAQALARGVPLNQALAAARLRVTQPPRALAALRSAGSPGEALELLGQALLERSRDVWESTAGHPAYSRILGELAPDEARIVALLGRHGPQPAVDVRVAGVAGRLSPQVLARSLSMVGPRAGVRHPDRVPLYLDNLVRLGLVWLSTEPVDDLLRYQVVEVQPDVLEAVRSVRKARVDRRSIHLTPMGVDFARACFLLGADGGSLPAHAEPPAEPVAEP